MSDEHPAAEIVHENPWFRVARHVSGPHRWYRIEAPDSAMVVGTTDDGRLLLIRGRRPGSAGPDSFELPGGIVDRGEQPVEAAVRELAEETGWTARDVVPLGSFQQAASISSTRCHVFAAKVAPGGAPALEVGESWSAAVVDPVALSSLVASGQIHDGATLAALTLHARSTR